MPEQALQESIGDRRPTLEAIFPTRQEESRVQKARKIFGTVVSELSDEELEVYLAEFQYLIESWLDEYEKQVFNNLTLNQLLKEG